MASSERFNIGFSKVIDEEEQMFISVTPGFEHGPGIQRDGITSPRMRDPHSVPFVCHSRGLETNHKLETTIDPFIQRAGTWSLYKHLKEFNNNLGSKDWLITGVQSCGDLTMNPWHVAYIRKSYVTEQDNLCGLLTENDEQEPLGSRIYRCIVKWNSDITAKVGTKYSSLDLTFHKVAQGRHQVIIKGTESEEYHKLLSKFRQYNKSTKDISALIDFALSGKPVVEKQEELSLSNAIDKFQDIRHIFNLPTVDSRGSFQGKPVDTINFGEFQLFKNLNERRAALSSAVIIDLNIGDHVQVNWDDLRNTLKSKHFKEVSDSPNRRGQFRRYQDDITQDKVEIFFPHNVYPFGVLGIQSDGLICLASGGLSGRVGNTLEGITRIMYDFFGCDDAMVLDEGFDTFQIINPQTSPEQYKYTNDEILKKILAFTKNLSDSEHEKSLETSSDNNYCYTGGMKQWPLNLPLVKEIDEDVIKGVDENYDDVLSVKPHRTQMRSVIIFAKKVSSSKKAD